MSREKFLAVLSYVFLCFAWGSTYIGIRMVVKSVSPFWFAGIRFLISGAILLGLCFLIRAPMPKTRADWTPLFIMALLYLILGNGALCWGEQYVKGGVAANLAALSPLIVASIMALLPRGERLRPIGWLGLLIGLGGTVVLAWDKIAGSSLEGSAGEMVLLLACLSWSAGTIYARFYGSRYHPFTMTTFEMLFGGAGLMAIGLATQPPFRAEPEASTWIAFAYMIVVGGCLGFLAFTYLIQKMPATQASTFGYINPVVGLGLGSLVENETYAAHQLVGSAIILVAVFLVHFSKVNTMER